ncbi:MAG: DegT/DnrJ/EryC1/StrS family aminotransferase [Clostridia bacterium]|nr:DegT/DnrJ/EryC1/StrS family aminotransferase [Clostridia bacterium]
MKLALLGGEKTITKAPAIFPIVPDAAYKTVEEMMKKGAISMSPVTKNFEEKFANYIGREYGLCMCNGTTSIQSALFAVGVGTGDEVIVPSFTFWATVGPVVACNAIPVFADVDLELQTLTAETIEKVITPKTKAIIIVHTWGTPCEIEPIIELAKKHNIKVVEDCSHAHGATYHGKKVGSFGDVGCFSLQGSKILSAGEGGILVTDSKEYYERACALGHYERIDGFSPDSEYKKFAGTGLGFKHRANPLGIAIADAGLDVLDERNEIRNNHGKLLESLLADVDFLKLQRTPDNAERVYAYHYMRYVPENLKNLSVTTLCKALAAEGVAGGTCGYGRLHKAPLYTESGMFGNGCPLACPHYGKEYKPNTDMPNTEILAINDIMIAPRFENVGREFIEEYALAYHKIAENIDDLLEYEEKLNKEEKTKDLGIGRSINSFK